jgi:eukaryotic-like serine/threonine-protein kinase
MTTDPLAQARDPLLGTRIDGRYLVQGVLGRGGMGVVYDGVHEQLGRPVAIKVLGAGIAGDPVAVQRFLREARTASQLTHGNIVDVSDLGVLPDGRPYLVMAKMDGEDFATVLEKHGIQTPRRTAELLYGAAAALDLIHAKGYVHRDVKPENLMHVVREDGSEATLLLDFGIVGLITAQSARLTAEGSVFGTPAYLPPEVIQGAPPHPRGDVYALATVAFELMCGVAPFNADNPLRILPMKIMNDAPRMSEASGRVFAESIEAVMARGLVREPDERWPSAGEFVAALEAAALESSESWLAEIAREPKSKSAAIRRAKPHGAPPTGANTFSLGDTESSLPPLPVSADQPGSTGTLSIEFEAHGERRPRERRVLLWGVFAGLGLGGALLIGVAMLQTSDSTPRTTTLKPGVVATPEPHTTAVGGGRTQAEVTAENPTPSEPAEAAPPPIEAAVAPPPPAAAEPQGRRAAQSASTTKASGSKTPRARVEAQPQVASAAELLKAATRELTQGHLGAAADLYAQAAKVDPRSEAAFRGLGLTSERLGKKSDAIRAFRRALSLAPNGQNADMLRARLARLEAGP